MNAAIARLAVAYHPIAAKRTARQAISRARFYFGQCVHLGPETDVARARLAREPVTICITKTLRARLGANTLGNLGAIVRITHLGRSDEAVPAVRAIASAACVAVAIGRVQSPVITHFTWRTVRSPVSARAPKACHWIAPEPIVDNPVSACANHAPRKRHVLDPTAVACTLLLDHPHAPATGITACKRVRTRRIARLAVFSDPVPARPDARRNGNAAARSAPHKVICRPSRMRKRFGRRVCPKRRRRKLKIGCNRILLPPQERLILVNPALFRAQELPRAFVPTRVFIISVAGGKLV